MIKIFMIMTFCISIGICSSCKCNQLLTMLDCQQASCSWSEGSCLEASLPSSSVVVTKCESYNSSYCALVVGCAYYNNKCLPFTGCESYNVQTSSQCQQISSKCNFNGSYCVEGGTCQNQVDETSCLSVLKNQVKACKWSGSLCETLQCSDAPQSQLSTYECESFLNGCIAISNSQSCTPKPTGKKCSSYTSSGQKVCSGLKADDGNCVWDLDTLTCGLISCELDTISNTDEQCQSLDSRCVTTGYGCTDLLKTCDSYFENGGKLCSTLIGTDGSCKKQSISNQCEAVGCSEIRGQTTCIVEQKCKWISNACWPVTCEDAPTSYTSEAACQGFLNNCRTNGNGCYTLPKDYTCEDLKMLDQCTLKTNCFWANNKCQTFTNCQVLVGSCTEISSTCKLSMGVCTTQKACGTKTSDNCQSDISCAWNETTGECTVFVNCESAQLTSYAQCSTYNSNCGDATTYCIQKTNCEQYQTEQLCQIGDLAGLSCIFQNNSCRSLVCSDLTYTKHEECYIYSNKLCISNGITCQNFSCSLLTDQPNCNLYQCSYDGTNCTNKATNCSEYLTKQACISDITKSCVFVNNVCQEFVQCSDANDNQLLCDAKDCYYFGSECKLKTCELRTATDCTFFQLDTLIQSCSLTDSVCQKADQNSLTRESCYSNTKGEYFWDTFFSTCKSCSADQKSNNYTYFVYQPNTSVKLVFSYGSFLVGLICLVLV